MSLDFTTQQLTGGARFTPGVKIGNWNEDIARQEIAARDYENRRSQGKLLHLKKAEEKNFQIQTVPHSFTEDGLVRYGDSIMLSIGDGKAARYLCSNVFLKVASNSSRVTAGANNQPQARSTFTIMRPGGNPSEVLSSTARGLAPRDEDVLLYGDRVVLGCSPYLVADAASGTVGLPLVLSSTKANISLGNTRKGMQEVVMTSTRNSDAEWIVTAASGDRLASDGTPVRAGEEVALAHAMSSVPLGAVAHESFPTDFGSELEVHCMKYAGTAIKSMNQECALPISVSMGPNRWRFVYSSSRSGAAPPGVRMLEALTPSSLLDKARASIAAALGPNGIRSFSLALTTLDARGSGFVPREAAKLALFDHGATFSEEEFAIVFGQFGTSFAGTLRNPASALLPKQALQDAVKGSASGFTSYRQSAVREAYAAVCAKVAADGHAGPITIGSLKGKYDGKFDPRVVAAQAPGAPKYGGMTAAESAAEFGRQWPRHPKNTDPVSLDAFMDYYSDVSACFGYDGEFEELVANTWHVPGKGNWKGKASKKVHIDFFNGSSTDAILPGAEDIADDDFEALIEACGRIGMGGIARLKVLGMVYTE